MQKHDQLLAVSHLPDVHTLVRRLSETFSGKLTRQQAENITLTTFIEKNNLQSSEISKCMESFITAWNIMASLFNSSCAKKDTIPPMGWDRRLITILNDPHSLRTQSAFADSSHRLIEFLVVTNNSLAQDRLVLRTSHLLINLT